VFDRWRYHNHAYGRGGIAHQGHSGQMHWTNPQTGVVVACFGAVLAASAQHAWTNPLLLRMAEAIDAAISGQAPPD